MDPRIRLRQGQEAAAAGRHADALREYLWFHEHALEHERSLYGVRLSFALGYWYDLAKVYPPALEALEEVRDRKARQLLDGEGDREFFHDVEAINETLGCEVKTYELFTSLEARNPQLASQCARLAMPAIVKSGDFALARRYTPRPIEALEKLVEVLNDDIEDLEKRPPSKAPRFEAYVHNYAESVRLLVNILRGANESEEARRVEQLAVDSVRSASARDAVRQALQNAA